MSAFFFVDRISGGFAVLVWEERGGGEATLPVEMLPSGVQEGDWLSASFSIDAEKSASMRDEIANLMDELGDEP